MKCAVVVVLFAGLAASVPRDRLRVSRQYDRSDYYKTDHGTYDHTGGSYEQGYQGEYQHGDGHYNNYQHYSGESTATPVHYSQDYHKPEYQHQHYVEQPNIIELNHNLHYADSHENNYVANNLQYAPVQHGGVHVEPHYTEPYQYNHVHNSLAIPHQAHLTPVHYQPTPLEPFPVQYNQYQTAQQNFGGYAYLFDGYPQLALNGQPQPQNQTTPSPPSTKAPPQQPNNILSAILSISGSSSGSSSGGSPPRTTAKPATTTAAPAPQPPAQIYSFANYPAPLPPQQQYFYPRRSIFL